MTSNTPCWLNIPTVEKCCCLKLKTGGIIIACVCLIPVVYGFGTTGWAMITAITTRSSKQFRADDEFLNMTKEFEVIEGVPDSEFTDIALAQSLVLVSLAICVLYIYGAFKEKRLYMVPFITVIGIIVNTVICSEIMRTLLLISNWIDFTTSVVFGGLGLYSMVILLSYYRELQQKPLSAKEDDVLEAIEEALW